MLGRLTMEAIYLLWRLMERYRRKLLEIEYWKWDIISIPLIGIHCIIGFIVFLGSFILWIVFSLCINSYYAKCVLTQAFHKSICLNYSSFNWSKITYTWFSLIWKRSTLGCQERSCRRLWRRNYFISPIFDQSNICMMGLKLVWENTR